MATNDPRARIPAPPRGPAYRAPGDAGEPRDVLPPAPPAVLTKPVTDGMRISAMLLSASRASDAQRFPICAPKLPPGVIPAGVQYACDSVEQNQLFEYVTSLDNCGIGFPGYPYLSQLLQRSEYYEPPAVIAGEMTRKWVKIQARGAANDATKKKIDKLNEAFEVFEIQGMWRWMANIAGQFGRSQLLIDIEGQEKNRDLPLPITPQTIPVGSLKGFRVVEPMWTSPQAYNSTDPGAADFYKPRFWYMIGQTVHHDRLLTIVPKPVPDLLKPAYNFGGLSLTQLIQPNVENWLKTRDAVNRLISNFSTLKWLTNMEDVLTGGDGGELLKRVRLFQNMRDNQGVLLLDKASEELASENVPLGTLDALQAQAQEHMASCTHIPLVKLTGITPSGLNASSDGEIRVFYDWIASEFNAFYREPLIKVLRMMQLHLFGDIDPSITVVFEPLYELDALQSAQARKLNAETGVALCTAGVLDPQEERDRLNSDPDSGYNNLQGEAPGLPELDEPSGDAE